MIYQKVHGGVKMNTMQAKRLAMVIALMALLFSACGDVTFNGGWPVVDYTGAWWWPDKADVYVTRVLSLDEPIEGRQRVRLEALSGSIVITGETGSGSIQLTADLLAGSDTREDAQAGLDQMDVIVTRLPDEIRFQTDQPEFLDGRQYIVDYTLQVPSHLEVIVTGTNGHITIENMDNQVNIDAMNGHIQLVSISGDIVASVNNGDIDSTATLPPGGEIMLSTVNGDIDLRIPTWTSAVLSAFSGNGTIEWHNLTLADISLTAQSLDGIMGSGGGMIDLDTVNGNINITGF
jgi:hypothetical protein